MPFLRTNEQVNRIVDVVNTVNLYQNYELSISQSFPIALRTDGWTDRQSKLYSSFTYDKGRTSVGNCSFCLT